MTPATKASLSLPPAALAESFNSVRGRRMESSRTESERSTITSERGRAAGATIRATDTAVRTADCRPAEGSSISFPGRAQGGPTQSTGDPEAASLFVADGVQYRRHFTHGPRLGGRGHRTAIDPFPVDVKEVGEDLHRSDPIGDGVMHLHDDGALAVFEPLDHVHLPQWAGPVESLHGDRVGEIQQVPHRPGSRRTAKAQVVREVEVGVRLPAGRRDRTRWGVYPLTKAGYDPGQPVDRADDPVPIKGAVVHADHDDGRTQERVLLDGPHESVGIAHAAPRIANRSPSDYAPEPAGWRRPFSRANIAFCAL